MNPPWPGQAGLAPDWQGRGIGKEMMQFAVDRFRETGCYKLALTSGVKTNVARGFYESLGFKKHGYSLVEKLTIEGKKSS